MRTGIIFVVYFIGSLLGIFLCNETIGMISNTNNPVNLQSAGIASGVIAVLYTIEDMFKRYTQNIKIEIVKK